MRFDYRQSISRDSFIDMARYKLKERWVMGSQGG
jgi:hypothetical protein